MAFKALKAFLALALLSTVCFLGYLYLDKPTISKPPVSDIKIFLQEELNWDQIRIEITGVLSDLIQIPTVRKDEIKAAIYLQKLFLKEGISAKIIPHPERSDKVSLVAEIGPEESDQGIILLNHLDVVEVNEAEWSVPPFAGEMKNNIIYGRGALDMKGMASMQLMAFLMLHRMGYPLKNKIMFLSVPDEESGGALGAKFLLDKHEDLFDGYQYVLNEGGFGIQDFPNKGNQLFTVQTSEKGILTTKVTVHSKSGHGSMPEKNYSSLELMRFMMELQTLQEFQLTDQTVEFFDNISQFYSFPEKFLIERITNPFVQKILVNKLRKNRAINAMVTNTVSITGLGTDSQGHNVIPAESSAVLDIRMLPGTNPDLLIAQIKDLAKKFNATIEVLEMYPPSESTRSSDLYEIMAAILKDNYPKAKVTPYLSPGATDSRYFREKGFVCYGLIPVMIPMEDINKLHGKDENVSLDNLVSGVKIILETLIGFNQLE